MPLKIRMHNEELGRIEGFFADEGYKISYDNRILDLSRKDESIGTTALEDLVCECLSGTLPEDAAADEDNTHRFARYFLRGLSLSEEQNMFYQKCKKIDLSLNE